jgi:transcriptional/translational regulatory protein YebC/TACO1
MLYIHTENLIEIFTYCLETLKGLAYTLINKAPTFTKLIDMLEDDDDVQNVWHNAEFPEGYEG